MFPDVRMRRLRQNEEVRGLVCETRLSVKDFIAPLFVRAGSGIKSEIKSLPGQFHFSPDRLCAEVAELKELGIPAVLLFGLPESKDERGTLAFDDKGVVQQSLRLVKESIPGMLLVADLCFCEYTSHGHCGVIVDGDVDNDLTLVELGKQAVSLARAGADVIAPSGMMDGMVGAVREALDAEGFKKVIILSYAAKYASAFYGPFREAAGSQPSFGDRRSYQMDPANVREALREVELDIAEGADMVMVKPALAYLDVISLVKEASPVPVAAYNVSGEYAMLKAAAEKGLIDETRAMMEMLVSIKRAGADIIISYFAKDAARLMGASRS